MGKTKTKDLRQPFLIWQCQIRQTAMREEDGRPSPGMCPRVLDETGAELSPSLTVLLVPKAPEESTAFFRFQVMKSPDPRETYEKALRHLLHGAVEHLLHLVLHHDDRGQHGDDPQRGDSQDQRPGQPPRQAPGLAHDGSTR
jgi:hypothetical protein